MPGTVLSRYTLRAPLFHDSYFIFIKLTGRGNPLLYDPCPNLYCPVCRAKPPSQLPFTGHFFRNGKKHILSGCSTAKRAFFSCRVLWILLWSPIPFPNCALHWPLHLVSSTELFTSPQNGRFRQDEVWHYLWHLFYFLAWEVLFRSVVLVIPLNVWHLHLCLWLESFHLTVCVHVWVCAHENTEHIFQNQVLILIFIVCTYVLF